MHRVRGDSCGEKRAWRCQERERAEGKPPGGEPSARPGKRVAVGKGEILSPHRQDASKAGCPGAACRCGIVLWGQGGEQGKIVRTWEMAGWAARGTDDEETNVCK